MKKRMLTGSSLLFAFALALAASVSPIYTGARNTKYKTVGEQPSAESQSISGKITALDKRSFTLMASSEQHILGQPLEQGYTVAVMTFQIDEHTTVQGTVRVGSNVEVIYRVEDGTNIAINVRTTKLAQRKGTTRPCPN
jgi:hypothetical protein